MEGIFVEREDLVVGKAYYLVDEGNDNEIGEFHSRDEKIGRIHFLPVKGDLFGVLEGRINFTIFGSPFREVE